MLGGCAASAEKTGLEEEKTVAGATVQADSAVPKESAAQDHLPGKYRAADEHGAAQNVPLPQKPEGMEVETAQALETFLYYWNDLRNYAIQTGQTAELARYVSNDFEQEQNNYRTLTQLYQRGGWIVGGTSSIKPAVDLLISEGQGRYSLPVTYRWVNAITVDGSKINGFDLAKNNQHGFTITVQFTDEKQWSVLDQQPVGG